MDQANGIVKSLESASEVLKGIEKNQLDRSMQDVAHVLASVEKIDLNVDETKISMKCMKLFKKIKGDTDKLKSDLKVLQEENDWLQNELKVAQASLAKTEESIIELEEGKKVVEFQNSMLEFEMKLSYELGEVEFSESVKEITEMLNSDEAVSDEIVTASTSADFNSIEDTVPENVDERRDSIQVWKQLGKIPPNFLNPGSTSVSSSEDSANISENVLNPAAQSTPFSSFTSDQQYIAGLMLPSCERALQKLKELHDDEHPDIAAVLADLGMIHRDRKNYDLAIEFIVSATRMRQKLLGPSHPDSIRSLHNLEETYRAAGKFEDAIVVCKELLNITKEIHGDKHLLVAVLLLQLARNYSKMHLAKKSQKYYTRTCCVLQEKLGLYHAAVLNVKYKLAKSFKKNGDYWKAQNLMTEIALNIHETMMGTSDAEVSDAGDWDRLECPEFINVLTNLCEVYRLQGKFRSAVALQQWMNNGLPTEVNLAPVYDHDFFSWNYTLLIKVALLMIGFYLFA